MNAKVGTVAGGSAVVDLNVGVHRVVSGRDLAYNSVEDRTEDRQRMVSRERGAETRTEAVSDGGLILRQVGQVENKPAGQVESSSSDHLGQSQQTRVSVDQHGLACEVDPLHLRLLLTQVH